MTNYDKYVSTIAETNRMVEEVKKNNKSFSMLNKSTFKEWYDVEGVKSHSYFSNKI